jgi:hypothetical protein
MYKTRVTHAPKNPKRGSKAIWRWQPRAIYSYGLTFCDNTVDVLVL